MKKIIETGYATEFNMTILIEWEINDSGDPIGMEIVSFYSGEPNEKDTEYYNQHRKIKSYWG